MWKRIARAALVSLAAVVVAVGIGLGLLRDPRPNVLIIVWDTVRADHLSLHGYERPTSPNLDRFAEQAVVFEQAVSPSMWTVPSHGSLFTGQPPSAHGANTWWWRDGNAVTLSEWFSAHGYDTWAFSSNPNLAESSTRLLQGFDTVHHSFRGKHRKASKAATKRKLLPRDRSTAISPAFEGEGNSAWGYNAGPVARRLFRRFARRHRWRPGPWLAFINLMEAHHPRVPSMGSRERLIDDPDLIELGLSTEVTNAREFHFIVGTETYTERELQAMRGVYDAAIGDLDAITGRILGDLEALGVLEDTIVVIVSDHGEALGEHGLLSHRYGLYDEILWVPLVIRWDAGLEPRRVPHPVSPTALFATLLELTGTPFPSQDHPMDRSSLLGPPPEYVHAQLIQSDELAFARHFEDQPEIDLSPWTVPIRAVRQGSDKLLSYGDGRRELFDLSRDPGELRPRQDASRTAELEQVGEAYVQSYPVAPPSPPPKAGSEELVELLRALGYAH